MEWSVMEQRFDISLLLPGAIDLAAQSAGIIPGSPLPVLDTDGSSGISPLTSEQITTAISGQGDTGPHQNREPVTSVRVSAFASAVWCYQLLLEQGHGLALSYQTLLHLWRPDVLEKTLSQRSQGLNIYHGTQSGRSEKACLLCNVKESIAKTFMMG